MSSEGEARRLVLSVIPEPGTRQRCLIVFADAVEEANRHGRDVWAVTHTRDKIRLVVGHVIVCTLKDRPEHGPIWMALDKELVGSSKYSLERSGDWEWDNDRYPEYRTIDSRNGYYSPSEACSETWPTVRRLHFESIRRAANQTTIDPRTARGHSPALLSYVGKELGRRLPAPLYFDRHEDKERPPKSVMRNADLLPRRRPTQKPEVGYGREHEGPQRAEERRRQIEALLNRDAMKDEINYMSGWEFEDFMADLFRQKGYTARTTPSSGDLGVDLLLEVDGRKVTVQLKRWVAPVGNKIAG